MANRPWQVARWTLLVGLIAGGVWWWRDAERADAAAAVPTYEAVPLARGTLTVKVNATGTVSPRVLVAVGSQVSGRIAELLVDFNDPVRQGQVMARIDPRLFENELQRAEANLAAARANVRRAKAELAFAQRQAGRLGPLVERGVVAGIEADRARQEQKLAEVALESAEASVEIAKAAVALAKTNVELTTIVAPTDGIVISRDVDVGQTVAASLSAPQLFTVAQDLRTMEVHTHVAESDVGRLREGQQVEFRVDAFSFRTFAGTVKSVRYAPQVVQNVVTYDAVVAVDNADLSLRPGMTADVSFIVERHDDALLLPSAALRVRVGDPGREAGGRDRRGSEGGGRGPAAGGPGGDKAAARGGPGGRRPRTVHVLGDDGVPKAVQVQLGSSDGENVEVVSGLTVGDRVVVKVVAPGGGSDKAGATKPKYGRLL